MADAGGTPARIPFIGSCSIALEFRLSFLFARDFGAAARRFRVLGIRRSNRCGGGKLAVLLAMVLTTALPVPAHGHPWMATSAGTVVVVTTTAPTMIEVASRPQRHARAQATSPSTTPVEAIESARLDLLGAVAHARRGELSQQALRMTRLAIEARLSLAIARMEIDLRPGEFAALGSARARLNQAIIRSQEWEVFGPKDRPEWGWYPSRDIESTEGGVVARVSE